jgi:ABC-type multidrug transport system ATPase subunit
MARFRTKRQSSIEEQVEGRTEISGLGDRLKDKVKGYSKGMKVGDCCTGVDDQTETGDSG